MASWWGLARIGLRHLSLGPAVATGVQMVELRWVPLVASTLLVLAVSCTESSGDDDTEGTDTAAETDTDTDTDTSAAQTNPECAELCEEHYRIVEVGTGQVSSSEWAAQCQSVTASTCVECWVEINTMSAEYQAISDYGCLATGAALDDIEPTSGFCEQLIEDEYGGDRLELQASCACDDLP